MKAKLIHSIYHKMSNNGNGEYIAIFMLSNGNCTHIYGGLDSSFNICINNNIGKIVDYEFKHNSRRKLAELTKLELINE